MSFTALLFTTILLATVASQEVYANAIGLSNQCSGVADGYFVRDLSNCQGYYFCEKEVATFNRCPGDFYFNELSQLCDYSDKVMCHICQQQTGVQILPHPQQCNQFITCSEGASYVGQCTEGYAFDRRLKVCNPVARVNCEQPRCPEQDDPNDIVYLPGVERCDEYFICRSGSPIQKFCAPGLYWDDANDRCDVQGNVKCLL
uniref:Chitin-binding type-2 domain-containing protein n=1 Tax=Anopheles farauti TaxID=69004 RepID=A0A182QM47_9DIPT